MYCLNIVLDNFKQAWWQKICNSGTLCTYKYLKTSLSIEAYLDSLPKKLRKAMSQLRLSSHSLYVETGRYTRQRIDRSQRYCTSQGIEDEFHFVIKCPIYKHKRKNCIKSFYIRRPSMQKFVELMTLCNRTVIKNLSTYICQAFVLRNSLIVT